MVLESMSKTELYQWKTHPVTIKVFGLLLEIQGECKRECLESLNLHNPDPIKAALLVAFNQGKVEIIKEIFNMEGSNE
jgi:hypothetical protein